MRNIFATTITVICMAGATIAAPVETFTGFVGFGDSFSDKGRFGQLQAPSNQGRFTDGITWMEVLGQAFTDRGQGNFNMAVGGATAGPANTNDASYAFVDAITPRDPTNPDDIPLLSLRNLSAQVASFATAGFDKLVGDNPLTTIFIGGNDLIQTATPNPLAIVGAITAGIKQVAALGSAFDSFMIATLPDLSLQPSLANAPASIKDQIRDDTMAFNSLLVASLMNLAFTDDLEIEILDLFSATDSIYAEAQTAELILNDVCTPSLNSTTIDFNNKCIAPGSSAKFLFVDNIHPGDFTQSRWGAAAVDQVGDRLAPIPLPAGLPMLLVGIAGFGLLRARRMA